MATHARRQARRRIRGPALVAEAATRIAAHQFAAGDYGGAAKIAGGRHLARVEPALALYRVFGARNRGRLSAVGHRPPRAAQILEARRAARGSTAVARMAGQDQ